jgi:hypothetical protein
MIRFLFAASLLVLPLCCHAGEDDDYMNAATIRASDIPADAPVFARYPAGPAYTGKPAAADVRTHARSRMFRTVIREGAKSPPNFAGHYTVVDWGCGTGCVAHAIVDARTGAVFHPPQFTSTDNDNLDYDEVIKPDGETVKFRLDSKLLIVIGGINEDPALRGVSYFLWDKNRLKRLRFVHRPYEAKASANSH